jgi:hypothetical protein
MKTLVLLAMFMGQMLTGNYRRVSQQTIVSTVFNEGASFASITGTSPATNSHGNLWVTRQGGASLFFGPSSGAGSAGDNGNLLNTGAPSYTVTFSGLTNTATQLVSFSGADATNADYIDVHLLGAGGIALVETVSGTSTTIQTQAVTAGATGSIVAVVHGTSIAVTAFGQAPMLYTIPPGHGDIGGQFIGMLSVTSGTVFGGVKVTVP